MVFRNVEWTFLFQNWLNLFVIVQETVISIICLEIKLYSTLQFPQKLFFSLFPTCIEKENSPAGLEKVNTLLQMVNARKLLLCCGSVLEYYVGWYFNFLNNMSWGALLLYIKLPLNAWDICILVLMCVYVLLFVLLLL